jgi:MFS family permease
LGWPQSLDLDWWSRDGVAFAGLAFAPTFSILLVVWCLLQTAQNAYLAPVTALMADRIAPRRQGLVSAITGTMTSVGSAAAVVIGAHFVTTFNQGFLVVALFPALGAVLAALLAPDQSNVGETRNPLTAKTFLDNFAFPRHARDFYFALFGRLALILGFFAVVNYQLYILTDYFKVSETTAAGYIAIAGIIQLVASVVAGLGAGAISDRLNRRKAPVFIASTLIGVAAIALLVWHDPMAMLVFTGLGGLGMGMYMAADAALVIRVLPNPETKAKDLGVLNMANTGGQILAPICVAPLIAAAGYPGVFVFAMVVCILSAFLILPIRGVR